MAKPFWPDEIELPAVRYSAELVARRAAQKLKSSVSTAKTTKNTLKAMQLANAIIAGLKSAATTAVCVACRARWIKKAIIAKYETIVASTNRNRRTPDLLAVTRNATTSVALYKFASLH